MNQRIETWRIPHELRAKVAAAGGGIGRRKVAAMFGISESTVANIRREFGVKVAPRGWPAIWGREQQIQKLNARRWPLRRRGVRPLEWAKEITA